MNLSVLASMGQLALSVATALIAFAVYRVQADKLFLEMREKRIGTIDTYRDTMTARLDQISKVNRSDLDQQLNAGVLQPPIHAQWAAEIEMGRWFGDEIVKLMTEADRAVKAAMTVKIEWCAAERGSSGNYDRVNEAHLAALSTVDAVIGAANPYVRAGRRGLTLGSRIKLWRSKRSIPSPR